MKYEKIEYGESVNMVTGESWKKSNIVATIEEGDDIDSCRQRLVDKMNEWNKGVSYNNFTGTSLATTGVYPISHPPIPEIDQKKQDILDILNDPTTILSDLENEKLVSAITKYGLRKEYDEKRKQL